MRSSRGALGVARNRFVCEQLQLQALFGCRFWLLPALGAIETLAIGGSLDQLLDYVAGGDQAAAPGPHMVSAVEHKPSLLHHSWCKRHIPRPFAAEYNEAT